MCPCPLDTADYVAVEEVSQDTTLCPVNFTARGGDTVDPKDRWFEYTCVRYLPNQDRFRPSGTMTTTGTGAHSALAAGGLSEADALEQLRVQGPNRINVAVPGVFAALLQEFSEPVYVFQLMCIWCYMFWTTWNIAFVWLVLIFGSGAWKSLLIIRANQQQLSEMASAGSTRQQLVFRGGKWTEITAEELTLGDIVQIFDGVVTADIALLSGSAIVNESMLTGEPMPLQKVALEKHMTFAFQHSSDGKKHGLFAGTEVLQSTPDETTPSDCPRAVGMVVSIGGRTTKGQLVRMVLFPALVKFKYYQQLPIVYTLMTIWALACTTASFIYQASGFANACFTGLSFLSQSLNPMMAVSFTLGQSCSATRLREAAVACLNISRIPIAGKIGTMVFDKTGTITHGGMDLMGVRPAVDGGGTWSDEVAASNLNEALQQKNQGLLRALASCHSVTSMQDGTLVGNQVELVTMKALGWKLSSPGEARRVISPSGADDVSILRQLEFDHHRMTSGAVVRPKTGDALVYIKGAYDKIAQIVEPASLPSDYAQVCEKYAQQCYYVLAISWKAVTGSSDPDTIANTSRGSLEQGLQFCGLILFRNEMKEDSREAIDELTTGGINCVICTGDNTTTGVSIGRQSGVVPSSAAVLIGELGQDEVLKWRDHETQAVLEDWRARDGEVALALTQPAFRYLVRTDTATLDEILPLVKVYGRMKPDDKVKVITLWQDHGPEGTVTGMVGDGGNDCGALRTAHAGLALSEAEASMVSPFSSSKGFHEKGFISLTSVVELVKEGRACLATNMATFMYFMIYNLTMTTSKVLQTCVFDFTYGEWMFISTDIGLGMLMITCMVRCRPAESLAPHAPTASLFGRMTTTVIATVLGIYWLTAGVVTALLLEGPGKTFFEFSTTQLIGAPSHEWAKKADNYVSSCLFLLNVTVYLACAFMLSYGHVHRQHICKNLRVCGGYAMGIAFVLALVWAKPGDFSCIFRVNCDSAASAKMDVPLLTRPLAGISLSTGALGGCFMGPQLVSCKSMDGRCWVVPPRDGNLSLSWSGENQTRAWAPFGTWEDKSHFCKEHPYVSGNTTDPGNTWCFHVGDEKSQCGPVPARDLGPLVDGCVGPNNCFSEDFKHALTIVLVGSSVLLHCVYKFILLDTGPD